MGGKYRIILCIKGKYFTKFDFGSWDELKAKYGTKAVKILLCN